MAFPLLSVVARVVAAWMDGSADLSMSEILGNGELLVLATVIAAAGIGDLVFDTVVGPSSIYMRLKQAFSTAAGLAVVVVSVLIFGLATFENQDRASALRRAELARSSGASVDRLAALQNGQAELLASHLPRINGGG